MLWRLPPRTRRAFPSGFIEPCLPTVAHKPPAGQLWVHEIKHDGYRFICRREGKRVRVFTRRGNDWTDRVPAIAAALHALQVSSATIDGECVVCGEDGLSDFDTLRSALARKAASNAFLYAFDLLELDVTELRREPWEARRKALASLLKRAPAGIQLSEHLDGDGATIFRHACRTGLEGIVSKRRDAAYRSGRCQHWLKLKNPNAPAATRIIE